MNINPEFHRQLLLECNPPRLLAIPLLLAATFALSYLYDGHQFGSTTANIAMLLFLLMSMLWGARQAVDSIIDEYREQTWDTQRLSALGAWDLAWGKLLGSTAIVWYSSTWCLIVYAVASNALLNLPLQVFYGVITGLLIQSASMLLGLLAGQRGQIKSSSSLLIALIGVVFVGRWLINMSSGIAFLLPVESIDWYGLEISGQLFQQISLLLALFWVGMGCYRLMMQALGIRTQPWVWLGFSLFLVVYVGGFIPNQTDTLALAAFEVFSVLTYIGVIVERNEAMRIKRLLAYISQRNWRRSAEELPIWWLSLALSIPAALLLSVSEGLLLRLSAHFHFYPLAIVLLLIRDCAIYLYFSYGSKPQRALGMSVLTGVLLYGILPGLFTASGQTWITALVFPLWADSAIGALLFGLLQTGLILSLLYRRWQQCT